MLTLTFPCQLMLKYLKSIQINSIIRATSQSLVHYCCFWHLFCIAACSKGGESRAKWNYISDCGHTLKNTTHFSSDQSYFPSSNSILEMPQSETPKHKAVTYKKCTNIILSTQIPIHTQNVFRDRSRFFKFF